MTGFDHPPEERVPSFVRPFLGRGAAPKQAPQLDPAASSDVGVRPYYLTGGRTRADQALSLEALVQTTARGRDNHHALQFEQRTIAELCEHAVSVAEIAARLRVPLGVATILVSDMAGLGLLQIYAPVQIDDDISLIQRLIHGVRAL